MSETRRDGVFISDFSMFLCHDDTFVSTLDKMILDRPDTTDTSYHACVHAHYLRSN